MSQLYFGSDDSSHSSLDDDHSDLPFPQPINRAAFAAADFDSTEFLSSLNNRFQTLEDLQNELRELSQSVNRELVDLVNDNYPGFLSLGSTLRGGEDKVQDVRVGLLGFQRDVGSVRDKINDRRREVSRLLEEKKALRQQISQGRALLDIDEKLDDLEIQLGLKGGPDVHPELDGKTAETGLESSQWSEDWTESLSERGEGENETDDHGVSRRLRSLAETYRFVKILTTKYDPQHPFLVAQGDRLAKVKGTVVRTLETSIRQEDSIKTKQRLIELRAAMDD